MWRRDHKPDPRVERELEALDAALAGSPGADPGLLDLIRDVRSCAPAMTPAFATALGERVTAGFPSPGRSAAARSWKPPTRLVPALGVAASVLVGLVIGLSTRGGHEATHSVALSDRGGQEGTGSGASAPAAKAPAPPVSADRAARPTTTSPSVTALAPQAAPLAPVTGVASPPFGRKRERAASLALSTSAGDLQDVADGVVRVTESVGGIVQTSEVDTGDAQGGAAFTLRIPGARLDDAIAQLSKLAHVASLQQSSQDITAPFVSVTGRLSDLRAERQGLLKALARATTLNQTQSIRARLRANRSEIAAVKGQLAALRRRADFATVDVTVDGNGKPVHHGGAGWTPRDALHDAGRVLEVAAGVALVAAAVLVPLAALAAFGVAGASVARRRRRERALDAA